MTETSSNLYNLHRRNPFYTSTLNSRQVETSVTNMQLKHGSIFIYNSLFVSDYTLQIYLLFVSLPVRKMNVEDRRVSEIYNLESRDVASGHRRTRKPAL